MQLQWSQVSTLSKEEWETAAAAEMSPPVVVLAGLALFDFWLLPNNHWFAGLIKNDDDA